MASSTETPPVPEPEPVVEAPVEEVPPSEPPPEVKAPAAPVNYLSVAEVVLRFLLFASAVVAVVVIVSSKETVNSRDAKFNYSPALIYFVAALSVAGLYSIITTLSSFYTLLKPGFCPQLLSHFLIVDVLLLGIVSAATGSAGAIAYTGLKGNSHLRWGKVCNVYDKFCTYVGASVAVSLFASVVLALLVLLSLYSISKKIPK
ncbi:CASP-like protein 1 [Salvia hispanica]|uniref:CASP-like protein 1 n=1 Tax=Salvia hispanica TaxID=49212 RepID=UPI002009D87F|nr:CASP-like protein 1 [Salvia hispanica]